jgi:hypothetical protein
MGSESHVYQSGRVDDLWKWCGVFDSGAEWMV